MNERLKRIFLDFEKAFNNLETAAKGAKTELEIDGTIKRFELCYELSWKLIKELLANLGIICKNPRNCFKQAVINDLIREEDVWLNMIDDRNELVHLYEFANSRKIFENIRKEYSTAAIATMDWLENIPDNEKRHYSGLFNNFDEQMYFDENHRVEYLKKYRHFKDTDSLKDAKNELKVFYQNYGRPSKYYALVMLDGDDMGRWLSGEFLDKGQNVEKFHELLSEELGEYAQTIRDRAKEQRNKLVYAGGDDVMAFVNLKYMFKVLEELRVKFPKFENLGFDIKDNHKSSASAGIVIAHYKTPLLEVLKWARRMEKEAKEKGGRDAFAIAVLKHSGEINKTMWKWELEEEKNLNSKNIKLLEKLIKELQDDNSGFSYSFITNLDMEFQKLGEIKKGIDKMLLVELRRLLIRSSMIKGDNALRKEKVEEWQRKLFDCYIDSQTETNFFSFLNIADFLARKTK